MSVRDSLLKKIRGITEALPERAPLPSKESVAALRSRLIPESSEPAALEAAFCQRWREASGVALDGADALKEFLQEEGVSAGYIDPAALQALGLDSLDGASARYERVRVDEIQFGVTLATAAIAETGTIVLTDRSTPDRLAALAPWVHVAVVRRSDIVASVADCIAGLDADPSVVLVTGPSKTADIEGILIEGVHGPGRQAVVLV